MKTRNVILVDDNETDCFIHQRLLQNAGFVNILTFDNVDSALNHIQTTLVIADFIFIGLYLPLVDGFYFIDKFGELGFENKGTEIIVLSASLDPRDHEKAKQRQVKFIEKPLTARKLDEILAQHTYS